MTAHLVGQVKFETLVTTRQKTHPIFVQVKHFASFNDHAAHHLCSHARV